MGFVLVFVLGQHILASFLVIILSQTLTLRLGYSVAFRTSWLQALIACFRKEGSVSRMLPVSCCVQQQSKAPCPASPWNKEARFRRTSPFC